MSYSGTSVRNCCMWKYHVRFLDNRLDVDSFSVLIYSPFILRTLFLCKISFTTTTQSSTVTNQSYRVTFQVPTPKLHFPETIFTVGLFPHVLPPKHWSGIIDYSSMSFDLTINRQPTADVYSKSKLYNRNHDEPWHRYPLMKWMDLKIKKYTFSRKSYRLIFGDF